MQKTIISDTSSIILLEKIGELELLKKLFGEIIITDEIAAEYGKPLPAWFKILNAKNKDYKKILTVTVDTGEASAIALAVELKDCLLIIDDLRGRKLAQKLGIHLTGVLEILADAKSAKHIQFVKPLLEKIKATNFRISEELEEKILKKAGEL